MQDIVEIKKNLDRKMNEKERLLGQKESFISQLKILGYNSIKEAKQAVKDLSAKIEITEEKYKEKFNIFKEKYDGLL